MNWCLYLHVDIADMLTFQACYVLRARHIILPSCFALYRAPGKSMAVDMEVGDPPFQLRLSSSPTTSSTTSSRGAAGKD